MHDHEMYCETMCVYVCVCVCMCVRVCVCVCGGGGAPEYVYSVGNTLPVWPKMTFIFVVGNFSDLLPQN